MITLRTIFLSSILVCLVVACGGAKRQGDETPTQRSPAARSNLIAVRVNSTTQQAEYSEYYGDPNLQDIAHLNQNLNWKPLNGNQAIHSQESYPTQPQQSQWYFVENPYYAGFDNSYSNFYGGYNYYYPPAYSYSNYYGYYYQPVYYYNYGYYYSQPVAYYPYYYGGYYSYYFYANVWGF